MKVHSCLLSRKEVAEKLAVSTRTIIRLEQRGVLSPLRISRGIVRHTAASIEKLIN
jgi:DNA-binding transcriptional MerR regulator